MRKIFIGLLIGCLITSMAYAGIIEKVTKDHYKVTAVNLHNVAASQIETEYGDIVTVYNIFLDPEDPSYYILEIEP